MFYTWDDKPAGLKIIVKKLNPLRTVLSGGDSMGKGIGFRRIRRVTGYLTGDVKFMNNAKQAEVSVRVKHA